MNGEEDQHPIGKVPFLDHPGAADLAWKTRMETELVWRPVSVSKLDRVRRQRRGVSFHRKRPCMTALLVMEP